MSNAVLHIANLYSSYGPVDVLKDVTIEVEQGELVALVGANGAGKSTLLRCISGIQTIDAGNVYVKSKSINNLATNKIVGLGIGHCPEGRQVFSPLDVETNLLLGSYSLKISKAERQTALQEIYQLFPILEEKRALQAGSLSGGQQQMLAIGRTLMGKPDILLFDEPSMGLAPLLVEEIFNVIKKLHKNGATILLVEQNANMALSIANRGYVMETGKVFMSDTAENLLKNEAIQQAYLGH